MVGETFLMQELKLISFSLLLPLPPPSSPLSLLPPISLSLSPPPPLSLTGVMAARGILDNPAMYAGYSSTPVECVQDWVDIAMASGVTFTQFHHHLMHMLDGVTARTEKRVFNTLTSTPAVLEYLSENYGIT